MLSPAIPIHRKIVMPCTRPITAQSYLCPAAGIPAIRFKSFQGEPNLELPCNKCESCKLRKAKEWAIRCWHESQMHEQNAYVTLTYDDPHLPAYHSLDHRDVQLFLKRLRKKYPNVKYFMCGEYGDQTHRPHYHIILFGYYPPDPVYHRTKNGNRYYKSKELDKFWRCGFTDTSGVSYHSSGYVARYTLKKQNPKEDLQDRYTYLDENGQLQVRPFEYVRMSTGRYFGTGIGGSWFKKYAAQTATHDYVLDPNGHKCPVPKYYLDILKEDGPAWHEHLAQLRVEKARANPDNSPERLTAIETCVKARLKQLPRPYL